MREFADFIKNHNVWLASVARAVLSVLAAFGLEMTPHQMALLVVLIEVVFGTGQAKMNVAEPRVDIIAERKAVDIMANPDQMKTAVEKREAADVRREVAAEKREAAAVEKSNRG
jgi:hypothetical protein